MYADSEGLYQIPRKQKNKRYKVELGGRGGELLRNVHVHRRAKEGVENYFFEARKARSRRSTSVSLFLSVFFFSVSEQSKTSVDYPTRR